MIFLFVPFSTQAQAKVADSARGTGGPFGLGVLLGDPFGINGKYFLDDTKALNFGLGYGYSDEKGFQLQGDYLIHPHLFLDDNDGKLSWFVGAGASTILSERDSAPLNLRIPFGLSYAAKYIQMDTFLEIAPGVEIVNEFDFAIDVVIGTRYFF